MVMFFTHSSCFANREEAADQASAVRPHRESQMVEKKLTQQSSTNGAGLL